MPIFTKKTGTKMLRTLIIDDEPHIRETLQGLLMSFCPQVKVIGQAGSVKEGEKEIRQKRPDLVLLDIKMGDGTGFDLLNRFETINFKIIFVTAWEKYAIQAFGFSAIDYLLKPVNPEKLVEAVERAFRTIQSNFNIQLKALRQNMQETGSTAKKIILRTLENIYLLDVHEIIHCYSEGNYTVFETSSGEKIMVSKILKEYDDLLADSGFLRVHRSHLINLKHIRRLSKMEGGAVIMSNGSEVPVSTSGKERLLELFEELAGGRGKLGDGRWKSEVGRPKTEDGRWKSEVRRPKSEDRRRKTEDGSQKKVIGNQFSVFGNPKSAIGNR